MGAMERSPHCAEILYGEVQIVMNLFIFTMLRLQNSHIEIVRASQGLLPCEGIP